MENTNAFEDILKALLAMAGEVSKAEEKKPVKEKAPETTHRDRVESPTYASRESVDALNKKLDSLVDYFKKEISEIKDRLCEVEDDLEGYLDDEECECGCDEEEEEEDCECDSCPFADKCFADSEDDEEEDDEDTCELHPFYALTETSMALVIPMEKGFNIDEVECTIHGPIDPEDIPEDLDI